MQSRSDSFDSRLPPAVVALTLAGGLPFVAAAVASISDVPLMLLTLTPTELALSYGLIIVSFMAGALWGYELSHPPARSNELIKTNLVTVLAWLGSLLLNERLALAVLAAGFVYLLWMDSRARRISRIGSAYLKLRALITGIVVLALITVALA